MADVMMKVVLTENGEEYVPYTQAEIDQWNADMALRVADEAAQATADAAFATQLATTNAKLEALGLTPTDITTLLNAAKS